MAERASRVVVMKLRRKGCASDDAVSYVPAVEISRRSPTSSRLRVGQHLHLEAQGPVADIPHAGHSVPMTVARAFLLEALQRVADGGEVTESALDTAMPDPFTLDPAEKTAWEELSHWADDDDIREQDERYAASKRERIRDHVVALLMLGR